jgi:hypothetical protein
MDGLFANPAAFLVAKEMPAHKWWSSYGSETLSACKRNWITFEFIYSERGNKLTSKRGANLVVFSSCI